MCRNYQFPIVCNLVYKRNEKKYVTLILLVKIQVNFRRRWGFEREKTPDIKTGMTR